jgi:putative spermidine/putrescine transport system permease protein
VLFSSPAIVPGLVIGFALLRFFVYVTAMPVFLGLYIGHTAILFPYTVRVISSSLYNLDPSIEEAAISLGASRLGTFIRVVLPNVRAGVVAAFILAFITSFNNVPISLFLTGPGVATLPIQMLVYMEYYFDPTIAALSSLIILFTILIVQGAERLLGISKYV